MRGFYENHFNIESECVKNLKFLFQYLSGGEI